MTAFSIQAATVLDAQPLRDLAMRTFHDTFAEGSSAEDMDAYLQTAFALETIEAEILDDCNLFLLLLSGETPYGYAKLRQGTREDCVQGDCVVELERLYVDKSVWRRGYGSALMEAAIERAVDLGCDAIWLGVWEHNDSAIAFYGRWGFEKVGEHPFVLGDDHQTDWVMQRRL